MKKIGLLILTLIANSGCASLMMADGPDANEVQQQLLKCSNDIQLIDVNASITSQLLQNNKYRPFSQAFPLKKNTYLGVGPGDVLDFSVWETPPATLFTSMPMNFDVGASSMMNLPPVMVGPRGTIDFPFVGEIRVAGLTLQQIQRRVQQSLRGKANNPQILVRLSQNVSANVTILGEVTSSLRLPLTPGKERLLDALAAAHGVKVPTSKTMIQLTRGNQVHSLPLDTIIRDPKQNIYLQPGDVITALAQSGSFTVLGATGRNEEIGLEAQGINLAQALGRAGGLEDSRADAKGVFIFRFEERTAVNWPQKPVYQTVDKMVPVIYRIDFKNPRSFFIAQRFPIKDKDIIYVSNAPIAEFQKFINIIVSATAPVFYVTQMAKR